ncbi:MAG: cytidine deaminase [Actinobacteria bacterium]|uniref:Unannotated protein n=1 Tax=freshwater metagenome TaxID=449393 RepID=A0A6J7LCE2_9ZZZZ|nr:cytidine deaminase [Actinomycetota bacterium]
MTDEMSGEDAKLVTLARGARGRIGAPEGAAIRDEMGRTYSGATIHSGSLQLTALQLAVAQAIAAGATGVECAVVVGSSESPDIDCVAEISGSGVPVLLCSSDGAVRSRLTT